MSESCTADDLRAMHRRALLTGVSRALGLFKRVPETLKARGLDWENQDLVAVLCAAVACKKAGAGRQRFRRPETKCQEWPDTKPSQTATQIIIDFDLYDLLEPV